MFCKVQNCLVFLKNLNNLSFLERYKKAQFFWLSLKKLSFFKYSLKSSVFFEKIKKKHLFWRFLKISYFLKYSIQLIFLELLKAHKLIFHKLQPCHHIHLYYDIHQYCKPQWKPVILFFYDWSNIHLTGSDFSTTTHCQRVKANMILLSLSLSRHSLLCHCKQLI